MSNVFAALIRTRPDGRLPLSHSGSEDTPLVDGFVTYFQGLPLDLDGNVYSVAKTPIRWNNGIPFSPNGRVAMAYADPNYYNQGLPYAANGTLSIQLTTPNYYSQGLGFSSSGRLACVNLAPPPPPIGGFSNGFSTGFDV